MTTTIRSFIAVNVSSEVPIQPHQYNIRVTVEPADSVVINITDPIIKTATQFLSDIISGYIDEDRELKTLLNFGGDTQDVIISKRTGPLDRTGVPTIQFKLLKPLPENVGIGTTSFVSREVANTLIDKVRVRFAPEIDDTPYLRPKNLSVKPRDMLGKSLNNITLKILSLETGSLGGTDSSKNVFFDDVIYRRWYSYDFNSSELNIDYTDYNNFVFYGSAAMRLLAFSDKLKKIEYLTSQSKQFSGTVFTGSLAHAGTSYIMAQSAEISKNKEDIIRSFDRYEQFLYFTPSGSTLPYSASAYYADGGVEYNPISYWPKDVNNIPHSVYSVDGELWLDTQLSIASRYDEFNVNNLVNTIPSHIQEDEESGSYITFISMIGHFFDLLKPYIDQFPSIYSRYINPEEELSKDLVGVVAESVGFPLPTLNSIYNLSDNVIGTNDELPRRDYTIETYKRLLHNIPYFTKTKGTRTALVSLLKTFGITENMINVNESGTQESSSVYIVNEFTTGLDFTGISTYITAPVSHSNRIPYPRSMQINFSPILNISKIF